MQTAKRVPWRQLLSLSAILSLSTLGEAEGSLIDGLEAYWKLDEASGDAVDVHGDYGLDDGSPGVGQSTSQYILGGGARSTSSGATTTMLARDSGDTALGGSPSTPFTVTAWIRPTTLPAYSMVLGRWKAWGDHSWTLMYSQHVPNRLRFVVSKDGWSNDVTADDWASYGVNGSIQINTDTWYFVACGYDGTHAFLRVNGGSVQTAEGDAPPAKSNEFALFNKKTTTDAWNNFVGQIDEVGFWSRALTSSELDELYNSGDPPTYGEIIGGDTEAPSVPTGLAASNVTGTSFTLTWNASTDNVAVEGYEVFKDSDPLDPPVLAPLTSVNVTSLSPGTTYAMNVQAFDAEDNTSNPSTTLNVTTQGPYGGTPWSVPGVVQAENYDTGGEMVAYHDGSSTNEGGVYRSDGVDIESRSGGGYNVGWMDTGEWLEYTVNVSSSGSYAIDFRVASDVSDTHSLEAFVDGASVGEVSFGATGGWQSFQTETIANVNLTSGSKILRVHCNSSAQNLDWIEFRALSTQTPYLGTPWAVPGLLQAENYDVGGEGIAYSDATSGNEGGVYRSDGVDIESRSGGGYDVGWMDTGEWLEYTINVSSSGSYAIDFRVASDVSGTHNLEAFVDGVSVGDVSFGATGGWQSFQTETINNVTLTAGQRILRVYCNSSGQNLDWIEFRVDQVDGELTWIDIGSPATAGTHSYNFGTDTYSITAGGVDMWGTSDQFHFGHEEISGDFTLVTRIASLDGPHAWSRTGIGFRSSLAANAAHVSLIATEDHDVDLQWRSTVGGTSSNHSGSGTGNPTPIYLKLERIGNIFTAYTSPDGAEWTELADVAAAMPSTVYAGIVACAVHASSSVSAQIVGYASTAIEPPEQPSIVLYVAPTPVGNDATGDGSDTSPYATIRKARDRLRELTGRTSEGVSTPAPGGNPANWDGAWIVIGDGIYTVQNDVLVTSVNTGTSELTVGSGHGLANGDRVQVLTKYRPGDGVGAGPDYIIAPLSLNTFYYVREATSTTVKLAASPGGSAITITGGSFGWNRLQKQDYVWDERDGGTSSGYVEYRAAAGANPRFVSGWRVPDGDWLLIDEESDDSYAWARLPVAARGHTYRFNINAAGIDTGDLGVSSPVPDNANFIRLIVGDELKWMSRYPNWPDDDAANWKVISSITGGDGGHSDSMSYLISGTGPGGWNETLQDIFTQGSFDVPYHIRWQPVTGLAVEGGSTKITAIKSVSWSVPYDFNYTATSQFMCLRNAIEGMTSGSYVWNRSRGYIYYWSPSGAPTGACLTIPMKGIQLGESGGTTSDAPHHLCFRSISFVGARRVAVEVFDCDQVQFVDCNFLSFAEFGAEIHRSTNILLDGCTFKDGAQNRALRIYGGSMSTRTLSGNKVMNCDFTQIGRDHNGNIEVAIQTSSKLTGGQASNHNDMMFGFELGHNTFSDIRDGVTTCAVGEAWIHHNTFTRCMTIVGDAGIIGALSIYTGGGVIEHNQFIDCPRLSLHHNAYGMTICLYFDMLYGWTVQDNTFTNVDHAIAITSSKKTIVRRNKFTNAYAGYVNAPISIGRRISHADEPGEVGYDSIVFNLASIPVTDSVWTTFDPLLQDYRAGGSRDELYGRVEAEAPNWPIIVDNIVLPVAEATYQGAYSGGTTYYQNGGQRDVVIHGGVHYMADNPAKNGLATWGTPGVDDWTPVCMISRDSGDGSSTIQGVLTGVTDGGLLAQLNYPVGSSGTPENGGGTAALSTMDKLD